MRLTAEDQAVVVVSSTQSGLHQSRIRGWRTCRMSSRCVVSGIERAFAYKIIRPMEQILVLAPDLPTKHRIRVNGSK